MMDGYQELANAIVAQAGMDYLEALEILREYPDARGAMEEVQVIEQFMYSSWFGVLTKADPDYLIRKMREAVRERQPFPVSPI